MPRSKDGKKRNKIDKEALECAIKDIISGSLRVNKAAEKYGLTTSTVSRHYQCYLKRQQDSGEQSFTYDETKNAVKKVFTDTQENELVDYLKQSAALHYGLTAKETLRLAYQFAEALSQQPESKIKVPEEWVQSKMAGKNWLRGFRQRHQSLTLRKPEATSLARSTSFNQENVKKFFDNLHSVLERHKFTPEKIYNLDETGNSTVHRPPKILCAKGIKQVGSVTSGERGVNVTMLGCINAIGNSVPPLIIFPRVNFKDNMLYGAPTGSIGGAHQTGWSTEGLFVVFLKHFIAHTKPSKDDKVLILLDNHETHISVEALDLAKDNGIVLLTFPPHTSHKLQPLDRTVYGPYKTFYNEAMHGWMIANPGKPVTIYDVAGLIGKAYVKAFSKENIEKGFKVTGICPFDRNIFKEEEFLSSYVTDRPQVTEQSLDHTYHKTDDRPTTTGHDDLITTTEVIQDYISLPSTSSLTTTSCVKPTMPTPESIRPFPKAGPRKTKPRGRQPGKSRVLTDTPEKNEIGLVKNKSKNQKQAKPMQLFKNTNKKLENKSKRKKCYSSTSEESEPWELSDEDLGLNSYEDLLNDVLTSEKEFIEDLQFDIEDIKSGDFVLVKVAGKKEIRHYVAEIVEKNDMAYEVKYFEKTKSNTFIRKNETIYELEENEIVSKLPPPIPSGTSKRQMSNLKFPVDFTSYNVF